MWIVKNGMIVLTTQEWIMGLILSYIVGYLLSTIVYEFFITYKKLSVKKWKNSLTVDEYRRVSEIERKYDIWKRDRQ